MKMFVVFVILLHVSQHALALVVEVNEGEDYVLLPCRYSSIIPETNPTVTWTRNDLDLKSIHLRREGGDDLTGQNQRYSRRTSMRSDALDTGDFSLTLRKPEVYDSGNYTCTLSYGNHGVERRLTDIELEVKDQQVIVKVVEGSESAILPCKTTADLSQDATVEWTRSDVDFMLVHVYSKTRNTIREQDGFYRVRTMMNEDPLRTGDLSLTLKYPTDGDSGGYVCTIYRDKDILRQKVVLQVKERSWAKVLVALLVLLVLVVVSGGLLYHFRQYLMSVYEVKVDSGVKSVQLPCKAVVHIPKDAKVEWKDMKDRLVHVYGNINVDQPEEQHQFYKGRTEMKRKLLKFGDFSLNLKHPKGRDTKTYTCTVYSKEENILIEKKVLLQVKGSTNDEIDSPGATGNNHPEDLSLTLKHPTDGDNSTYTCIVCSREGNILKKQVELKVRVCQVEVDEGVESLELPFKTTGNLPKDVVVVWRDSDDRKVHVYENGSDQLEEQHQIYRDRTKMNEDLLGTGDLSLTLNHPTERDSGEYTCIVNSSSVIQYKIIPLKVKGRVQVQDGGHQEQKALSLTELHLLE
ncbi:uncharacterized protein LOC120735047 isoform X1 [Simochromis diagramma]|uniref:uncharacterized protein LOC120735047 isoform X1 n=1 Tax=Simochromis diagramma TaxID=43689 RepID=UPI001A7EC516|nr:uncharacterized protein LOC120735047 isoform X1 [Simochromis diagramma]